MFMGVRDSFIFSLLGSRCAVLSLWNRMGGYFDQLRSWTEYRQCSQSGIYSSIPSHLTGNRGQNKFVLRVVELSRKSELKMGGRTIELQFPPVRANDQ